MSDPDNPNTQFFHDGKHYNKPVFKSQLDTKSRMFDPI